MIRLPAAALALAAASAAPALATGVNLPVGPDFAPAYSHREGRRMIVEFTPRGQTVRSWTRMITLQSFPDLGHVAPATFAAIFARRFVAACPGARVAAVPMGALGGVRIDCASSGQTVFARALSDGPDMQMVQVAFKGLVLPQDAAWARGFLGRVSLQR